MGPSRIVWQLERDGIDPAPARSSVYRALSEALACHGVPSQILTDNGKVFTARFGAGPGPVMFYRICADNGIRYLLTARIRRRRPGRWSGCTR
jgi:hypothetical protein